MFVYKDNDYLVNDYNNETYPIDCSVLSLLRCINIDSLSLDNIFNGHYNNAIKACAESLTRNEMIIPRENDETCLFYPMMIDIETVRHCNARCVYCPQSIDKKPSKIMSIVDFNKIVEKMDEFTPSWITFNHYGEPLLDPFFKDRAKLISRNGIKLLLATNGTMLNEDLVTFLNDVDIHSIHFNFPSLDKNQWSNMMGLPGNLFEFAKNAIIRTILKYGDTHEINIVVNSVIDNRTMRATAIKKHFSQFGKFKIILADTRSRCGVICNKHVSVCNHEELFFGGCERITNHLYVSFEGKCFLCSDDYYQKVILGDIMIDDITSIMNSETAKRLKSEIFGLIPMRKNLICRKCVKLRKRNGLIPSLDTFPI